MFLFLLNNSQKEDFFMAEKELKLPVPGRVPQADKLRTLKKAFNKQEWDWLEQNAHKFGLGKPSDYMFVVENKDGEKSLAYSKSKLTTRHLFVLTAIYDLIIAQNKKLFVGKDGLFHIYTNEESQNPKSFYKSAWDSKQVSNLIDQLTVLVVDRWNMTSLKRADVAESLRFLTAINDDFFNVDPFFKSIYLTAQKIINHELEPVMIDEIYDAMTLQEQTIEPYRAKTIDYMITAPINRRVALDRLKNGKDAKLESYQAVPILVGKQGIGKSTLIKTMSAGFADGVSNYDYSQETILKRGSNAYIELAELSGVAKSSTTHLKDWITQERRGFVPKYENEEKEVPFTALLIGTTNETDLLKDVTGNRRYLPIEVEWYNRDKLTTDFIMRAMATYYISIQQALAKGENPDKLLSLEIQETQEDMEYKNDVYAQGDPDIVKVKQYLKACVNRDSDRKSVLKITEDSIYFKSVSKIDEDFTIWQQQNAEVKLIYSGKVSKLLLSLPATKKSKAIKIDGKTYRSTEVNKEELIKELNK